MAQSYRQIARTGLGGLGTAMGAVNRAVTAPGRAIINTLRGIPNAAAGFSPNNPQVRQNYRTALLDTVGHTSIPIVSTIAQGMADQSRLQNAANPAPRGTKTYNPLPVNGIRQPNANTLAVAQRADSGAMPANQGTGEAKTTSLSGTPTSNPQYSTTAGPTYGGLTPEQQKEADARQYLQDESATSLAMGSKSYVDALRGGTTTDTTSGGGTTGSATTSPMTTQAFRTGERRNSGNPIIDQLRNKITSLSAPSAQEQALQDQLAQYKGDAALGISGLEGQGRGIPLPLIRGQQSKLNEQAQLGEQTLMERIAAASAQRQAELTAAQQGYTMASDEQKQQEAIREYDQTRQDALTKPTEVGNSILQYDPTTGSYKTLYTAPSTSAGLETLSAGQTLYDPNTGQALYTAPSSANEGGFTLGNTRFDANGNVIASVPDTADTKVTDSQNKALGFLNRAQAAEADVEKALPNVSNMVQGVLPHILQGENYKLYKQGAEAWIKAVLRQESGAAIPPDEMDSYFKTYFPQVGDSQAVTQQKQASRQEAIKALQTDAGNAASGGGDEIDQFLDSFSNAGRAVSGSKATGTQAAVAVSTNYPSGTYGGECGRFVNRLTGFQMGNTYESKMAYVDPAIGNTEPVKPGDVFVMPYESYGHTGIIANAAWVPKDDGTYDIPVIDSNWNNRSNPEKVSHHYINSSKMSGFARAPVTTSRVSFA